jgi:hypothetical protein
MNLLEMQDAVRKILVRAHKSREKHMVLPKYPQKIVEIFKKYILAKREFYSIM